MPGSADGGGLPLAGGGAAMVGWGAAPAGVVGGTVRRYCGGRARARRRGREEMAPGWAARRRWRPHGGGGRSWGGAGGRTGARQSRRGDGGWAGISWSAAVGGDGGLVEGIRPEGWTEREGLGG
ncbi:uncharacterized protein [Miscanthus floridulus]|uniref:uncharacterized protein n=1 Tax=Miscanthus floridulus TaxID=154761 RepID=UPI0034579005